MEIQAWGPGFELRSFLRPTESSGIKAEVVLGAGAANPTPEGPRPLWGHGAVLVCGKWRGFVTARHDDDVGWQILFVRQSPRLFSLNGSAPLLVAEFGSMGYRPLGPPQGIVDISGVFSAREFCNSNGESVSIIRPSGRRTRSSVWVRNLTVPWVTRSFRFRFHKFNSGGAAGSFRGI